MVYKCNYHIAWVPKSRFHILKGAVKELFEHEIRMLCQWKGLRGGGIECPGGPSASLGIGTAESLDFQVDGYIEGKVGDKTFQELPKPEEEAILGQPFLGQGLLCQLSDAFYFHYSFKICPFVVSFNKVKICNNAIGSCFNRTMVYFFCAMSIYGFSKSKLVLYMFKEPLFIDFYSKNATGLFIHYLFCYICLTAQRINRDNRIF